MESKLINNVEDYLKLMVEFRRKCVIPESLRYSCFEEFVLSHGMIFSERLRKPSWVKRGVIKECFSNCLREAMRHPDKLIYCEGYATGVIPVHHAWLLYKNKVIDPTWDGREIVRDNTEYFGVPFNYNYIIKIATETGYYGVIDNFVQNYPLLRGEHQSSEFLNKLKDVV